MRGLDVLNEDGKPVFMISLLAELLEAQVTECCGPCASATIENTRVSRLQMGDCMNRCFAIALSFLTLTSGALAEPISVTDVTVVDGDTFDAHGQRYRMIGYDTPEVATPGRRVGPDERAVAMIAKERFVELFG